jgi:nucleoside-diphosphate-sugar epimerase
LVVALFKGFSRERIVPVVTDIGRSANLERVFENYRPHLVFHGAVRKNRPFLGIDLEDIGLNNYLRTFNLAKVASVFRCEAFVMISSLMAAEQGDYLSDSLRISEVSLEHFFSDTNTRLIIARLCDIIENRGGIVSIIENQIRNRDTVMLPSEHAQVRLISKDSAAEFILQALVEKNKELPRKIVFTCDCEPSVSLEEVASKLAAMYGLKLGLDFAIRYTEPPYKGVSKSQSKLESSLATIGLPLQFPQPFLFLRGTGNEKGLNFNPGRVKALFKEFVAGSEKESPHQDWRSLTQELIKLCKADSPHRGSVLPGVTNGLDEGTEPIH